jgi:uncharacterized membrane protein
MMSSASQPKGPDSLLPSNRSELVTVIAHFYRGELGRMAGWRDRIDRTSNWAITVVAAMLSLSLSTPTAHHSLVLFAMLLITLLLMIEARRYRFFDVYRERVRILERHYFANAFNDGGQSDEGWTERLASDLKSPRFNISLLSAMTRRLRRNYVWMYLILLLAWLLKISTPLLQPAGTHVGWREPLMNILSSAAAGPAPGWVVLLFVALLYMWVGWLAMQSDPGEENTAGEVFV